MIEINDAIHKTVTLSDREKEVADHPYMQRLRFIRQLGFVPLVYPSATHDRFSHAIGTMHIAGIFAQQMFRNESYSALARTLNDGEKEFLTEIIRLAGLLHDIGHAPFSHPAERVMPPLSHLDLPQDWYIHPREERQARHEDYSVLLLDAMTRGVSAVLDKDEAQIIASLIHHKKVGIPPSWKKHFSDAINHESLHTFVRSLVSGDVDCDRMDYLLRDSHFTGVVYGHFDLNWLIANLGVIENGGLYTLSISEGGIHAFEHYLFARYHMFVQVYMHKTVKCFEYYFQRALDEGETTYAIPSRVEQYVMLRDSTILETLFEAAARKPHSWSWRLINRLPAKRIARMWGDEKGAERIAAGLSKTLTRKGIHPFLYTTRTKFLDLPPSRGETQKGKQGSFLFGLSMLPMVVIRKQFGVVSMAPIADYSFILKHYHRDISVSDLYIPPEEYDAHVSKIQKAVKAYRTFTPSEIMLTEEV